ncbi:AAA family ATPase [Xylanimonas ulmi]|uniref:Flp pilus assembly CpaE family ATPase n=1 Tax=Xylanimonas ulmi TaxID=228973 RepID=A0A4Q7M6F7_9MICO|nr:MinD/ParA family protein [Xylanibacterium ulmi]RZS63081.1 Flp pilus assembly CpaE family ATPase [Xylanibacterium ulmi]
MSAQIILVSSDARVRESLTHVLAEVRSFEIAATVADAQGALDALERLPAAALVVVDAQADGGQGRSVARRVSAAVPLVGIVMLVQDAGSAALAAAMEVGARGVVQRTASLDEIVSRFESVAQWTSAARSAVEVGRSTGRGGRVIAVAGAKGGVGASVVALLLAGAQAPGSTVTLVDFDLTAGDLTAFAGVHTRRSIVDLTAVAGEITTRMLRETSYDVPGGLRLLPAPGHGERGEAMPPEVARAIVTALRFESDLAVIDVGDHLDEAAASVLEVADAALLVTTPDLPALRAARRTLEQWDRLAVRRPGAVDLVLNRRSKRDQVSVQLVERVVERSVAFTVPEGGEAFDTALNTATLLEVSTPVHAAVADVAESVAHRPLTTPGLEVRADDEQELEQLLGRGLRRASRKARTRRERRVTEQAAEAGQATVEMPVILTLGLLVLLVCGQAICWASGLMVARSAAQDGARTAGIAVVYDARVEADVLRDTRDALPSFWRGRSRVSAGPHEVSVEVSAPTVLPGVSLTATSTANVYREGR